MNAIGILARLTFKEAIRRKIALASILLGIAFLLVFNIGFHFMTIELVRSPMRGVQTSVWLEQVYNFLHLMAMYAANFMAIVFSVLISADTLSGEISTGTIQVTAAKPIYRSGIVLGKWIGNAGLLLCYLILLAGGCVLGIWLQSGYVAPRVLEGLGLIYLNGLLVMTVALAFSSVLSTLATGGTVFGLFGVAFIGGWVERIGSFLSNQTAIDIGIVSSLIMPCEAIWNLASNRMTSTLATAFGATPFSYALVPSPAMIVYTGVYLVVFILSTVRNFARRDL